MTLKPPDGTSSDFLSFASFSDQLGENIMFHGGVADGVTNNRAALIASITAAGSGGTVYFPPAANNYYLDVSAGAISVGSITFHLAEGATVKAGPNTLATQGNRVFDATSGAIVKFKGGTWDAPTSFALFDAAETHGIINGTLYLIRHQTTGRLEFRDVRTIGWSSVSFTSDDAATCTHQYKHCRHEGHATDASSVANVFSKANATLIVDDCDVSGMGNTGFKFTHAYYVYPAVNVDISNTRASSFHGLASLTAFGSFFLHTNDDDGSVLLTGMGTAAYSRVSDCTINTGFSAIKGNRTCPTEVSNCTITAPNRLLYIVGDMTVTGGTFNGGDGTSHMIEYAPTTLYPGIKKVKLHGVDIYCHTDYLSQVASSTSGDELVLRDVNIFTACDLDIIQVTSTSSSFIVDAKNCRVYAGTNQFVRALSAATILVEGSTFKHTGRVLFLDVAQTRVWFADNECSQTNAATVAWTIAPTIIEGTYNYGTKGYKFRNGAVASKQNGNTIAHGLGVSGGALTPTKYGISSAVAGHIAGISAVDATNITITLTDAAGVAIAVNENVIWWAEA